MRFENLAEIKEHNLAIVSNMKLRTDVSISGKTSEISRMNRENISASVNLSGYSEGESSIPIKVSLDTSSSGIRVVSKDPSRVTVKIDEVINEKMEAFISAIGDLEEGYVLGNIKPSEKVEVKGPSSVVHGIEKIVSEVDVTGMSNSGVKTGEILAYDKDGVEIENVSITPSSIDIEVPVLKTMTVPIRLNIVGKIPEGMDTQAFSIEPSSVMIRGNSAVINGITELTTQPVDVKRLVGNRVEVGLVLPDGVGLVDKDIKIVASSEDLTPKKTSINFSKEDIIFENLKDREVISDIDSLNIEFVQKNVLEDLNIKKEDVKVILNLKDLGVGVYELTPKIESPEQFKVERMNPKTVKIEIKKKGIF
ncbi:YbbR family protein [Peptoniphilus indolicus ATCC 29427]|uniref:YbbR family protein n=1 Tax=Peptoniphilus indolicus ATCC 29427 TaxID=997350 RepID=G4D4A7_9FIRM|nr:CdaR family protein [Peptoniphilus indolicus]EGY79655.1 YbbR family protein [Peptoniphilus indolicus ATCC 29427]